MENMKVTVDTGIRSVDFENEHGEVVCTLRINTADSKVAERYLSIIDNLTNIQSEVQKQAGEIDLIEDENEKKFRAVKLHIETIEKCIDEIDGIFGEGCIKNVFHECYELNSDFVPDEDMLMNFLDAVIPVMNQFFGERMQRNRSKYNVNRRGSNAKHTAGRASK